MKHSGRAGFASFGIARPGEAGACQPNVDSDRHPRIIAPRNCLVFQKLARSSSALRRSEVPDTCRVTLSLAGHPSFRRGAPPQAKGAWPAKMRRPIPLRSVQPTTSPAVRQSRPALFQRRRISPARYDLVADPLSWPATPKRRIILFSMKRIASRSRFARRSAIE